MIVEDVRNYLKTEGSLAGLSLAEGRKVEGFITSLIEKIENPKGFQEDKLSCGCKCSCHDQSPFHIAEATHKEKYCGCGLGPEHCDCRPNPSRLASGLEKY